MELESFSRKSALLSVYQDFQAKVFAKNMVWIMASPVQDHLDEDTTVKKNRYQIDFTQSFSKSKGVIALLFNETTRRIRRLLVDLKEVFKRTVEPIRQRRKYPRNHKAKPKKFFPKYKPIS